MGTVIEWKSAEQIIELLRAQNALVSGMSVQQAAKALGFTLTSSGLYVKTIVTTAARSVVGASAAEVAASAAGASATTTATNLVLLEGGAGGTATVGGLGAVALPVAAVVAAAAGGYLIGDAIYEANPSILDGVLLPLFNFVTGNHLTAEDMEEYDNATVPIIFDADANVYMDTGVINATKSYIQSQGITPAGVTKYTVPTFSPYQQWASYPQSPVTTEYYPYQLIATSGGVVTLLVANNKMYTYLDGSKIAVPQGTSCKSLVLQNNTWVQNGSYLSYDANRYKYWYGVSPTGYKEANNPIYTDSSLTAIYFGKTTATPVLPSPVSLPNWSRVVLPETQPGILPGGVPTTPGYVPYPGVINPFIKPVQVPIKNIPIPKPTETPTAPVVPVPNPVPDTSNAPNPAPDPTRDPSQLPEPLPKSDPIKLPDPADTGAPEKPGLPIISPLSSAATGLLHVYNPTNAQINQFGTWLWTTFSGDLLDTLSKLFNNPMDAVIGLHELYATPSTSGSSTIRAGYLDSGVASRLVDERYTEIKCGALAVPEYWGNYLDYAPYTKSYCYLPFIGIVELNTDDIVGSGVEITYKIDAYNGSCVAIITTAKPHSDESVTYQFPGNCSVEVPITSGIKSAMQGALLGAATLAIGAATGGASIAGATMIGAVQGGSRKNLVQHSGSFGSSYGAMGNKKPFLIIKRPKQKVVPGYNENYGYPAHTMVLISRCSGYLKAIEVDVVSPTATEEEKHLIERQLKSGIFVN